MIYDCFTFNNELDILELRLEKSYSIIDRFLLIESNKTHTGKEKPLFYKQNIERFKKWKDKIFHFEYIGNNSTDNWNYENSQRDYIRDCLLKIGCKDDDIIFISDVDEIINFSYITSLKMDTPFRIEMPFYYYFTNLRASELWDLVVCCQWFHIKKQPIGNRKLFRDLFPVLLKDFENKNGSHFSYLFSYSIKNYQLKIASFAHSEYNNFYFRDPIRLRYCISNKKDIYERSWINFEIDDTKLFLQFTSHQIDNSLYYYPLKYNLLNLLFVKVYIYFLRLLYRLLLKIKILNK